MSICSKAISIDATAFGKRFLGFLIVFFLGFFFETINYTLHVCIHFLNHLVNGAQEKVSGFLCRSLLTPVFRWPLFEYISFVGRLHVVTGK